MANFWQDRCVRVVDGRHGPDIPGACDHTRQHHGVMILGEHGRYSWGRGECSDCRCEGFVRDIKVEEEPWQIPS